MKHVVLVTDTWVPQVSGVVTVTQKTKELMEGRGYKVTIIHPGLFYSLPMPLYPDLRLAFAWSSRLKEILRRERPDYIHIVTEGPLGLAARKACISLSYPFTSAYHTHFPLYVQEWLGFLAEPTFTYLRWFHRPSTHVMVATRVLKAELERREFTNVVVTPFGVDTELFVPTEKAAHTKPVFVYVGRIAKEKNVEAFLKMHVDGQKLVIGDGADRTRLERLYPDAQFVGIKRGPELARLLADADVCVFPSRTDTFGLVVLEALACGVPVAAHPVMGPTEIITPGADGYLDEDLAIAAKQCLGLSSDNCRKKALMYPWSGHVDTFIKHLAPITPRA